MRIKHTLEYRDCKSSRPILCELKHESRPDSVRTSMVSGVKQRFRTGPSRTRLVTIGPMSFGDFFLLSVSGRLSDVAELSDLVTSAPFGLRAFRLFGNDLVRSNGGRCVFFK